MLSVAGLLYQIDDSNDESFCSRTLTNAEQSYSITELELLAIVFCCNKLRSYLIGHPHIIVRSDHKALSFLNSCRLTHGRLLRWSSVLQEYNLHIEYVQPKNKVPADILSRVSKGRSLKT